MMKAVLFNLIWVGDLANYYLVNNNSLSGTWTTDVSNAALAGGVKAVLFGAAMVVPAIHDNFMFVTLFSAGQYTAGTGAASAWSNICNGCGQTDRRDRKSA